MDALPWPAYVGVAGTGWLLAAICVRMIFTGSLVTRREHDITVKRAEKAEALAEKTVDQNGRLLDGARLGEAVMQALNQAANE